MANNADSILVLVKDDAILSFIEKYKVENLVEKKWIHCSGMLSTSEADSAHPLMTFTHELYELATYESIVFITEKSRKSFKALFPNLSNASYEINSEEKILYHAMCVVSGNLTSVIWKIFFDYLKSQNIPDKAAHPYLNGITANLLKSTDVLTGPFERDDKKVIGEHIKALKNLPIKNIYQAFADSYNELVREAPIEFNN
jgi:predicted short-subunit dehydrogenase-like oxidoreductase (DUF2520 family)